MEQYSGNSPTYNKVDLKIELWLLNSMSENRFGPFSFDICSGFKTTLPLKIFILVGKSLLELQPIIKPGSIYGRKKKKIYSWAFYDWANSAYSTTVMAGFFPIFFEKFYSNPNDVIQSTYQLG